MTNETIQKAATVEDIAGEIWRCIKGDFEAKGINLPNSWKGVGMAYGGYSRAIEILENWRAQLLTHHDKEKAGEVVRRLEEEQRKNKEVKPSGYVEKVDERAYNAALVVALSIVKEVYPIDGNK